VEKKKSVTEEKREALFLKRKNGYDCLPEGDEGKMQTYCEGYKRFLDEGKTERACVDYAVSLAEAKGFRAFTRGEKIQSGDKLYRVNRGKSLVLAVIGEKPLDQGSRICAAHIDSPRLDLKQYPLYEDKELAYLKTHYYGGVRKYQWVTLPLELHGVIILRDGSSKTIAIGNMSGDPVFTVSDLLPHLAGEQNKKPLGEAIAAEQLNLLVGSRPFKDDEGSERVKLAILDLLHEKYGIVEEDFLSAELMAVPAISALDVGFDRSMIGAYGQDDRVCAYAALAALLETEHPEQTSVCMLADKEEVGSMGVTGMQSAAFDTFMSDLCDAQGIRLKSCYETSFCLSADVTAAFDPNYPEVYEKQNSSYLNYGICLSKYSGSRGKSGASDASAEVMGFVRKLLNDQKITWQTAELGKTDQGGGGTVAAYMADRNIDTLDAGVPVLSMHSPFEVVSKLDCYMTYRAIQVIYAS
jgi:aspartyl aminopeptidase